MKIAVVHNHTLAQRLGLRPGDEVLTVNGQPIRDAIDFQFYAADEGTIIAIRRGRRILEIALPPSHDSWFGAEFEPFRYRCCGNHCVFCFVDQNPRGLRSSLYFKDEDYRLSFLYGNYVTLTNVSSADLQRIVSQRLSPLYISVHATDIEVRKRLLGLRRDDHLLQKIDFLAQQGIEMHAQIVLCPGWNDGTSLQKTVDDLAAFYPQLRTIAVVPVGLTAHRQGLPNLKAVNASLAEEIIAWADAQALRWQKSLGTFFIYLADEFYLLAEKPLPPRKRYEDFAQIENGVGMTRAFVDTYRRQKRWLPKKVPGKKIIIVTGTLAAPILEKEVMPDLHAITGLDVELKAVKNRFFGGRVSVSGLLTGQDIYQQLRPVQGDQIIALPPNCLNSDRLFLDDWTPETLSQRLGAKVIQPSDILNIFKLLL